MQSPRSAEAVKDRRSFIYAQRKLIAAIALALGDSIVLVLALSGAALLKSWLTGDATLPNWAFGVFPAWTCGAMLARMYPNWGFGSVEELRRLTLVTFFLSSAAAVLLVSSGMASLNNLATLALASLVMFVGIPFVRTHVKRTLLRFNLWGVSAVIYGVGSMTDRVVQFLRVERGLGFNPEGVYTDEYPTRSDKLYDLEVLGDLNDVDPNAPVAVLVLSSFDREEQTNLLEGPLSTYPRVLIIPDMQDAPSLWVHPRDLQGMLGLEYPSNLTNPLAMFVKRTTDLALVTLSAPLWLPVYGLIALLTWLEDQESPFFLQERIGRNGKTFKTRKFRTMVPNAEEVLRKKLEEDDELRREWEEHYKLKKDPRITRVGSILRTLSLDELPQLINVLRGEMSLVGPRPLPAYHFEALPPQVQDLRDRVRPGITGLWQVSGRSDSGNEGMIQWDPYYVRNWSLWLDAVIIVRTARAVLNRSGAY